MRSTRFLKSRMTICSLKGRSTGKNCKNSCLAEPQWRKPKSSRLPLRWSLFRDALNQTFNCATRSWRYMLWMISFSHRLKAWQWHTHTRMLIKCTDTQGFTVWSVWACLTSVTYRHNRDEQEDGPATCTFPCSRFLRRHWWSGWFDTESLALNSERTAFPDRRTNKLHCLGKAKLCSRKTDSWPPLE